MAARKRKKVIKKRAARKMNSVQLVAVGVIVLAVVLIVWLSMPKDAGQDDEVVGAPAVTSKQYDTPPPMMIDEDKQYTATVKMAKGGEFVIRLYPDKAPITVNNFIFLAREGYYTGTTFHRVLPDFMAQGGDPTGTGSGDPGYSFVDEPNDLSFDAPGILAMANSGPDTNGGQFFITYAPTPWLDGLHTIFGKVTAGMEVVSDLRLRDPNQNPDYVGDAIESITIEEK